MTGVREGVTIEPCFLAFEKGLVSCRYGIDVYIGASTFANKGYEKEFRGSFCKHNPWVLCETNYCLIDLRFI